MPNAMYCSEQCRKRAEQLRYAKRAAKKKARPLRPDRRCLFCGGVVPVLGRAGPPPKFCSSLCKSRYRAQEERKKSNGGACRVCGVPLVGKARWYCAEHKHTREQRLVAHVCQVCGQSFQPKTNNQKYCTAKCGKVAQRRPVRLSRECPLCGDTFTFTSYPASGRKFCDSCRRILERDRTRRRRALVESDGADVIDERIVYEKDGGICGICGQHIDLSVRYPHPMSLSLDHIVPISKGGTHKYGNVRVTHLACNCRRGNRDG